MASAAGESALTLAVQAARAPSRYSSNIKAHGMFRLVFPDALIQSSTFTLADGHVVPLHYQESGQARDHSDDVDLTFDRTSDRVHGTSETHPVDAAAGCGYPGPMSVQIELMRQLQAGPAPTQFKLFDKDQAKEYFYTRERNEVLNTPLGALDTVVYRSDRPGSDRVTRLWLAPKLNYLPLQAARSRKGSVDLSMRITALTRPTPDKIKAIHGTSQSARDADSLSRLHGLSALPENRRDDRRTRRSLRSESSRRYSRTRFSRPASTCGWGMWPTRSMPAFCPARAPKSWTRCASSTATSNISAWT